MYYIHVEKQERDVNKIGTNKTNRQKYKNMGHENSVVYYGFNESLCGKIIAKQAGA